MEEKRILDSWKEIAAYLGRSVKTCRRWEHELGLPIHRLEDSPKARVFAYPEELDQWVKKTQKSDETQKRSFPRIKKDFFPALVFLLILISIAIWQIVPQKGILSISSDIPCLLILPFQNKTGDKDFGIWGDMLPVLLTTDLFQSQLIQVVPDDKLIEALKEFGLFDAKKITATDLRKLTSHLSTPISSVDS